MNTKQDHLRLIMADYDHEELEAAQDWISRYQDELAEAREELERATAAQPVAVDLVAWIAEQREFSRRAYGPGARWKGCVAHIRKELAEIEADPTDLMEWVDVAILAFDGAWRAGHEPREIAEAMAAKLAKNQARAWPDWRTKREDEPIEHVEAAQPAAEAPAALSRAESDILAERTSQRSEWGVDHDDVHHGGELAKASAAYVLNNQVLWPFTDGWKPRSRREDLVRAAALLIAEVERLDRRDESFQAPEVREMHAAVASAPLRTGGSKCSMEISPASAEAPVAESAAQKGPFKVNLDDDNTLLDEKGALLVHVYRGFRRDDILRLLNAGLEAPKLRARVAELEDVLETMRQCANSHQARADAAEQVARNWEGTAAQHLRNADFYQGLLRRIGNVFGTAARTADDGTEQGDVLALKVPELVEELHRRMVAIDEKCVAIVGIEHAGKLAEGSTDAVIARLREAEAKLAAIGEKTISRSLVERHCVGWSEDASVRRCPLLPVRAPGGSS